MNVKLLCGVSIRVILSVVFAGIFYTGWMGVSIPVLQLGISSIVLTTIIWVTAPIVTATGFATGIVIFELFTGTDKKSKFLNIFKWSLAGCAIGAGSFVWFGPMLIVSGVFLVGTAGIVIREIVRIKRPKA